MKNAIVVFLAIVTLAGCKKDESSSVTAATTANFAISPSDNQTSVSQDASVVLSFSSAADKAVVEKNFRLIDDRAYVDSLCPTSKTFNHGSMMMSMNDTMRMNHMDNIHGLKGTFTWSGDGKTCVFKPDTLLRPGMQHMVHMREEAAAWLDNNMGSMGSMGMMGRTGMGNKMGMAFHFYTR
jgi:hypothetical protein